MWERGRLMGGPQREARPSRQGTRSQSQAFPESRAEATSRRLRFLQPQAPPERELHKPRSLLPSPPVWSWHVAIQLPVGGVGLVLEIKRERRREGRGLGFLPCFPKIPIARENGLAADILGFHMLGGAVYQSYTPLPHTLSRLPPSPNQKSRSAI